MQLVLSHAGLGLLRAAVLASLAALSNQCFTQVEYTATRRGTRLD